MKKLSVSLIALSLLSSNMAFSQNYDYSLLHAARNNDVDLVVESINPYIINSKDKYGNTALSYAIRHQNYAMVNALLANGANPVMVDGTNDYIYCLGLASKDKNIQRMFNRFKSRSCSMTIVEYEKIIPSWDNSSNLNWAYILGGAAVIGGGVAAVSAGGGGSGSDVPVGPESWPHPIDPSYLVVGDDVNPDALTNLIEGHQYSAVWNFGEGLDLSNSNDYNAIRLAYSLGRGYTGKITADHTVIPDFLPSVTPVAPGLPPGTAIKVAVVDSGVLTTHEDLSSNIDIPANSNLGAVYCEAAGTSNPDICGGNLQGALNDPNPTDSGHGTFIAGIIGASDNNENVGIIGVAPDSEILPYKIMFSDAGELFVPNYYIGQAFESAGDLGVAVVNNSYGISSADGINAASVGSLAASLSSAYGIEMTEAEALKYIFGDVEKVNGTSTYYEDVGLALVGNEVIGLTNPDDVVSSNFIDQMIAGVVDHDMVFVFAAGNESASESMIHASLPLYFEELQGNFINVVNFDVSTGLISDSSNHCGVTQNYCLAAPGELLVSTGFNPENPDADNLYSAGSGTSYAAPFVTGAVAVLKGAFPYLTGEEITQILFASARDLGEVGVDTVYGHGMLDLERATRPLGTTTIPVDPRIDNIAQIATASTMKVSSAIANSIKSEDLSFVILDSFNRTFDVKLNDYIQTKADRIDMKNAVRNFASTNPQKVSVGGNDNMSLYFSESVIDDNVNPHGEIELSYVDNGGDYGFNMYYGSNPYNAFVDDKVDFYNEFTMVGVYDYNALNPYFMSNSEDNFAFSNSFKINDKTRAHFGLVQQNYAMDYDANDNMSSLDELGSAMAFMSGISYEVNKNLTTKLELGLINEEDTLLGTAWDGAFGLGQNNVTYMASLQGDVKLLDNKLSLLGKINLGYTMVNETDNSLVQNISSIQSQSFALGSSYRFDREDNLKSNVSFMISQPIAINSGKFNLSLPTARDNDGNIYYQNHEINLDDERETNFQLAYNHQVNEDSWFNFGATYRDYVEDEFLVMLKFSTKLGN